LNTGAFWDAGTRAIQESLGTYLPQGKESEYLLVRHAPESAQLVLWNGCKEAGVECGSLIKKNNTPGHFKFLLGIQWIVL